MTGFWLAGGIALVGLVGAVVWAVLGALSTAGSAAALARGPLPGGVATRVAEPTTLVVYYEGQPVPDLGQLGLRVTGPGGAVVPVSAYRLDLRYDSPALPGTVGTAVATFDARRVGVYRVDSAFLPPAEARLAVGADIGRGFLQTLVGPLAVALVSVLAAVALAVLTAVRINDRYRSAGAGRS